MKTYDKKEWEKFLDDNDGHELWDQLYSQLVHPTAEDISDKEHILLRDHFMICKNAATNEIDYMRVEMIYVPHEDLPEIDVMEVRSVTIFDDLAQFNLYKSMSSTSDTIANPQHN